MSDFPKTTSAVEIINKLGLQRLEPEGGYFARTFKSAFQLEAGGPRAAMTAIYYLLTRNDFSAFHRLKSDEIYHYYAGARVQLNLIFPDGSLKSYLLGNDLFNGETPQALVPAGVWQASSICPGEERDWSLLGTTVAPGFEFSDFDLASAEALIRLFPAHRDLVERLTRN